MSEQPTTTLLDTDVSYLDCSNEASSIRTIPDHRRVWIARDITRTDWLIKLNSKAVAEVRNAADFISNHPVGNMARTPDDLELSECRKIFKEVKRNLDEGVGFAVVDHLPVDDYPLEVSVELYWVLGQLIARPVAQKRSGQMIYDVRDTSQAYTYGVRGSWTNVELNFHTDNAFGKCPPDYVGLFCKHPAKEGGISRFCSLYAVHQRLQDYYPDALSRLYQPMLFDRQKEHAESEPAVTLAPFFSWRYDRLFARANPSLVRKGYDVAGKCMDAELTDALNAVDEVSQSSDLWFEAALERGQIQYLNNSEVGHYRSEFIDHDESHLKRHLFRLWHRKHGSACYDGGTSVLS